MSLKAKIEAVIYAAEEPVTLAQLVAVFAAEVPVPQPGPEAAPVAAESSEITVLDDAGTLTAIMPEPAVLDAVEAAPAAHAEQLELAPLPDGSTPARRQERLVREHLRAVVDELIADSLAPERGIEIREIAGGYRMATKPEHHDAVRAFVKNLKPAMKLSPQALETLAVIAYKQPVTSPEIGEIRGVDSGGVLASLIGRKLVTTAGRKQVIGRPILYKTTKEFLLGFGLKDLGELPSMEEFEKMAGELAESDAIEADAMHQKAGVAAVSEEPAPGESANAPEQQLVAVEVAQGQES